MTHLVYQWFVTVSMVTACLGMLAVRNSPLVKEPPILTAGRSVAVGGWALLAFACVYQMVVNGSLPGTPSVSLIALGMLGLGTTVNCMARLLPQRMGHPCTDCPFVRSGETQLESTPSAVVAIHRDL